jgi:hypothetical protein
MLGGVGCDRDPAPAPIPKRTPVLGVEVRALTPLPPNRLTHFAPTRSGAVFWVQESEAGRETMFVMSDGGVPVKTPFSAAAVAQALGASGASGSIQSLAAGSDGKIYFYYTGGKGKQLLAAVGSFTPESAKTRIIADTAQLMAQTEMGNSLALARGTVLIAGNTLWVWLRHEDGYALLSIDVQQPGGNLKRPFTQARTKGGPIRMTSETEDLAIGAANGLVYLDRPGKNIWKIDPLGEASGAVDVSDLPPGMAAPSFDEKARMVIFAPEETSPDDFSLLPVTRPSKYPGLVILNGGEKTVLGRAVFSAPAKFNVRGMSVNQLLRDRGGWLAYDTPSGELLRLTVVER